MRNLVLIACLVISGCGGQIETSTSGGGSSGVAPSSPAGAAPFDTIDTGADVVALAARSGHICWTSYARANPSTFSLVGCRSETDGTRVELERDGLLHPWIAIHDERVFWSTDMTATIEQAPLAGGQATLLVSSSGPHGRFDVSQTFGVYWLVDGGNGIGLFSSEGSPSSKSTLVKNLGAADASLLAIDEFSVYAYPAAYYFANDLERLDVNSGEPTSMGSSCASPSDIAVERDHVLFSCKDGSFHWTSKQPGHASDERTLGNVGFGRIAASALVPGVAYVTDVVGGRLRRVSLDDASSTIIADGLANPVAVAADASGVYVADGTRIRRYAP